MFALGSFGVGDQGDGKGLPRLCYADLMVECGRFHDYAGAVTVEAKQGKQSGGLRHACLRTTSRLVLDRWPLNASAK
jgi:hypothetical protein